MGFKNKFSHVIQKKGLTQNLKKDLTQDSNKGSHTGFRNRF